MRIRSELTQANVDRASMEPLFFKAENPALGVWRQVKAAASMEPLFFKAENQASHSPKSIIS